RTARLVSKYRPPLPIIALTSHPEVQRQLLLSWGVQALLTREFSTSEEIFREAEKTVVRTRLARKGDRIVIIAGDPKGPSGKTEILKVQTIS
ncbi:pyruvate kinase, partial [Candidatus Bathyarchaeota archaeon]